jgi:hypothetical protein
MKSVPSVLEIAPECIACGSTKAGGFMPSCWTTAKDGCFDLFFSWKKRRRLGALTCKRFQETTKGTVLPYRPSRRRLRVKNSLFSKKYFVLKTTAQLRSQTE